MWLQNAFIEQDLVHHMTRPAPAPATEQQAASTRKRPEGVDAKGGPPSKKPMSSRSACGNSTREVTVSAAMTGKVLLKSPVSLECTLQSVDEIHASAPSMGFGNSRTSIRLLSGTRDVALGAPIKAIRPRDHHRHGHSHSHWHRHCCSRCHSYCTCWANPAGPHLLDHTCWVTPAARHLLRHTCYATPAAPH